MKNVFFKSVLLGMSLCFFTPYIFAEGIGKIIKSEKKEFFKDYSGNDINNFLPYAKMPDEKNILQPDHYKNVIKQFSWWLKTVLRPEWIPDETFIINNIKLLPANKTTSHEDIAFLSYRINEEDYMIVQTGGLNARMLIFIGHNNMSSYRNIEEVRIKLQSLVDTYFTEKIKKYIPPFIIQKTANGYMASVKRFKKTDLVNHAKCFLQQSELCLLIQKISYEDTQPAMKPMPDQWFSWCESR